MVSGNFSLHGLLLIACGVFWTLTYWLVIRKGAQDKVCGMPFAALCANLSWELLFTFVIPHNPYHTIASFIWFVMDLVIVWQYVKYSAYAPSEIVKLTLSVLLAMSLIYGFTVEFHDIDGRYSGLGVNLMMSLLFIRMLYVSGPAGQSPAIAWAKMIGTLCASLQSHLLYPDSLLLSFLSVFIFILDMAYLILIHIARHAPMEKKP